jgi:hypothetical protein
VSSFGFVGDLCFWIPFVVTLHWLDCSKLFVEKHDQYYCHVSSAMVAIVAISLPAASPIGTGLLNSYLCLRSGKFGGNQIGPRGAKALGDALKDNTTLTSLSLDLSGEQSWFRW